MSKPSIDERKALASEEWFPSCYFDDDRAGLVTSDSTIVLGVGHGLSYAEAKKIADEHNAGLKPVPKPRSFLEKWTKVIWPNFVRARRSSR